MTGVKGFDLCLHAEIRHHLPHSAQGTRGVGHNVVGFGKVHRATVQRADFRQAFCDMGHALGCADHIGGGFVYWKRAFSAAENDVAAHASSQVQNHIGIAVADAIGQLAIKRQITARRAGFRVAHVAMHHGRTRFGSRNRAFGDLLGAAWHMWAAILRAAGSCDGCGDKDLTVHGQRHGLIPL